MAETASKTHECQDCGRVGAVDFEYADYPRYDAEYEGPESKRPVVGTISLPRCTDRAACAKRRKAEDRRYLADLLGDVRDDREALAEARGGVKKIEARLSKAIRYALSEGASVTAVAKAAGLSRERVYQIRDGRR